MEIQGTKTLPYYNLDYKKGTLKIIGRSIDDEVKSFYDKILNDIKNYCKKPKDTKIIINMDYYNTRTCMYLKDIFNIIKEKIIINNDYSVEVDWYYDEDDIDMAEAGEDYEKLTGLNFNIISKKLKN